MLELTLNGDLIGRFSYSELANRYSQSNGVNPASNVDLWQFYRSKGYQLKEVKC